MCQSRAYLFPVFAALLSVGLANDQDTAEKGEGVKVSKLEKTVLAASVDFTGTLKLPFQSLVSLGSRIDSARLASDPVLLSAIARELAVAEKISGKNAPLTAANLSDEAITLVKLRNKSKEIEAVDMLLGEEKVHLELQKLARLAQKQESLAAESLKDGEISKGLQGTLIIVNLHDVGMRVYTNGIFRGFVDPFQTNFFYVNDPPGFPSVFEVRYPDGSSRASWVLNDDRPSFRWTIDPNLP